MSIATEPRAAAVMTFSQAAALGRQILESDNGTDFRPHVVRLWASEGQQLCAVVVFDSLAGRHFLLRTQEEWLQFRIAFENALDARLQREFEEMGA